MHVHLDMLGGLAGDMFLAAVVDAGLCDPADLGAVLSGLGFGDIAVQTERTRRGAIEGTHVSFSGWDPEAESTHRHLSTIENLLEESDLAGPVRDRAIAMFRRLGDAESAIHGIPLEEVHFHECGALDSIFDFVGAAWVIETLDATWSWGPVPMGHGTAETDHGTVPLPVPATARLLEGFETRTCAVEAELVTPTGATILGTLRALSEHDMRPDGTVTTDGYGVGTRELDELSNVVRALVFDDRRDDDTSADAERDEIVRLVAEIDDMSPELLAEAAERLVEAGALDVVREPVHMKKGRQGTRLSVLARPDDVDPLADAIFEGTTTFGLRVDSHRRQKLARSFESVSTPFGDVRVKVGRRRGDVVQVSPEFSDCKRVAEEADVTVSRVFRATQRAIADQIDFA